MSYDVAVYTKRQVSGEELRELVVQGSKLEAEIASDQSLTVTRGVRRRYSFGVGGPDPVDNEDVPGEVAAVLLGARYVYWVVVEGTIETEIPHAVRFARRLAPGYPTTCSRRWSPTQDSCDRGLSRSRPPSPSACSRPKHDRLIPGVGTRTSAKGREPEGCCGLLQAFIKGRE